MDVREMIFGLQHIGLPTTDVKKTMEFYKQFGFEICWASKTLNPVFLKNGNCVLEIYPHEDTAMCNGGIDHIALNVKDINETYKYVQSLGYETLENHICDNPVFTKGVKYFTILGPNHEKVEFNQIL